MITLTENDIKQMVLEAISQIKGEINERFTSNIYHFTTISNLFNILKSGEFRLSNGNKADTIINGKYPYYMSFTRERSSRSGYAATMNGEFNKELGKEIKDPTPSNAYWARLEIDGDKLNNNFKGKPVNYHSIKNKKNSISKLDEPLKSKFRQSEDRLFSNNDTIPLFTKDKETGELKDLGIIKRIDIYIPLNYRTEGRTAFKQIKWMRTESLLKDKIFLYSDKMSFDNIKGINNIDDSNLDKVEYTKKDKINFTDSKAKSLLPLLCLFSIVYGNEKIKNIINELLSKYSINVPEKECNEIKNMIYSSFLKLSKQEILNYPERINKDFLKNAFRGELLPIYQKCIEMYDKVMKTFDCDSLLKLRKKLGLK